jgi:glycosyltransferase involved in cell wall biosynthesis
LSDTSDPSGRRFWLLDLGDRPRPLHDLAALFVLRRAVREFGPDVVHAHGAKAALLSLLLPLPSGVPVVVTLHNVWRGGRLTSLLRRALRRATAVICVSEAVRSALLHHGISIERAPVIPNGVSLPPPIEREVRDRVTVAFIGRLTREKGIDLLIEAWDALIAEKRLNAPGTLRLVIAGDGPLRRVVEQWVDRTGSQALYLGYVEDVNPVYADADFVVIPSRSEGQSLTALEAMSHGLPVIAASVGGLREVVLDNVTGLLIPPESPRALADTISALARDRDLRGEMASDARARAEVHYSLGQCLDRTLEIYKACAG